MSQAMPGDAMGAGRQYRSDNSPDEGASAAEQHDGLTALTHIAQQQTAWNSGIALERGRRGHPVALSERPAAGLVRTVRPRGSEIDLRPSDTEALMLSVIRQSRGSVVCSSRAAPGTMSTAITVRPASAAKRSNAVVSS